MVFLYKNVLNILKKYEEFFEMYLMKIKYPKAFLVFLLNSIFYFIFLTWKGLKTTLFWKKSNINFNIIVNQGQFGFNWMRNLPSPLSLQSSRNCPAFFCASYIYICSQNAISQIESAKIMSFLKFSIGRIWSKFKKKKHQIFIHGSGR